MAWELLGKAASNLAYQSSVGTGIPGVATGEKHFRLRRMRFKALEVRDGARYGPGGDRRFWRIFAFCSLKRRFTAAHHKVDTRIACQLVMPTRKL